MPNLNDPTALKLLFVAVAGLAVAYYLFERLAVAFRLRRMGLRPGFHQIQLSSGSVCEVDLQAPKRGGAWTLSIRVRTIRPRNFRISLPLADGGVWAKMDRELWAIGQKAFELGMDQIEQKNQMIEAKSVSFRPLRFGHPGFIDFLGLALESIDWKLSWIEDTHAPEALGETKATSVAPYWYALGAAVGMLVLAYAEPVVNQRSTLLQGSAVVWAAMTITLAAFCMRFWTLQRKYRHLSRKPPKFADAFWTSLAIGMLSCSPIQHLNMRLDVTQGQGVRVRVEERRGLSGLGSTYLVRVLKLEGAPSVWQVEVGEDEYKAILPGHTTFTLKLHPGFLGMEWAERVVLDVPDRIPDRGTASGK